MITACEITRRNHRRAVRFFSTDLDRGTGDVRQQGAGDVADQADRGRTDQQAAAAVPPIVLLAAVHGIARAVRAGASGTVYRWAVGAVGLIGVGAFSMSFLALRDLMLAIGHSHATAWVFPTIIDTAVAVATMMLVALGDKPVRRIRTATTSAETQTPTMQRLARRVRRSARAEVTPFAATRGARATQPDPAQTLGRSAQIGAAQVDAEIAH